MPQIDELDTASALVLRQRANFVAFNTITGNYTLVAGDWGRWIKVNSGSAVVVTVPPEASVAFADGVAIPIIRYGSGTVTVTPGAGVTIYSDGDDNLIPSQYKTALLIKCASNTWLLQGIGATGSSGGGLITLSTPTLTMTAASDTAMDFSWTNVANESSYTVQIATNSGFTTGVQTATPAADDTAHQFTGLTASTLYYGRVKAVGDGVTYSDSAYGTDSETTEEDLSGFVVYDNFTGSAGNLSGHTPEEGGAISKSWSSPGDIVLLGDGTIQTSNGAAAITADYTYANLASTGDHAATLRLKRVLTGTHTNYDIFAFLLRADTAVSITCYMIQCFRDPAGVISILVGKYVAGTYSDVTGGLFATTAFDDGAYHDVFASVIGSDIIVKIDGTTVITTTDGSISSTANKKLGLHGYTDQADGVSKWVIDAFSGVAL